ncbi:MAG: HalOD1 output domain-containing protein [Haloarculaceae archaeon]
MGDDQTDDTVPAADIYHRQMEPDPDEAAYDFLTLLAEIEGCDVTDLPPMHTRIGDLLTEIFQDPPSAEAQVQVAFSYYGYRITVEQNGQLSLMKLGEVTGEQSES